MNYRVLMVTSEFFPLAKAGGLADAVADLSAALADRGNEVRVVMPRYYFVDRQGLERLPVELNLEPEGEIPLYAWRIHTATTEICVYLIDCEAAFGRDGIYTDETGAAFADNAWRFSLLSRAALELPRALGWKPNVFHLHDWQAGLLPAYLREPPYAGWFAEARTVFTIHNLGYQGVFPFNDVAQLRLEPETVLNTGLLTGDRINFLRCAVKTASVLTTVSPTYAREILDPGFGSGLNTELRARGDGIRGVLNGINYDVWDPAEDPLLPLPFDERSLENKALLARVLRWYVGLPQAEGVPLIGMVTRMVEQKGFDELLLREDPALVRILTRQTCQVVMLGSGPARRERRLHQLAASFSNLSVITGFDNRLAHLIEGASDFFLMPSRYEPCGLNQMYSMRYGTIPIVTRTGGLADTVGDIQEDPEGGTGYLIPRCASRDIFDTVSRALEDYRTRPKLIRELRLRGMARRFSWEEAARAYEQAYDAAGAGAYFDTRGVPG